MLEMSTHPFSFNDFLLVIRAMGEGRGRWSPSQRSTTAACRCYVNMIQLRYRLLFEVMMRCLVMFNIFGDELDDIYYVNVIVLVSDSGKCRSRISHRHFQELLILGIYVPR